MSKLPKYAREYHDELSMWLLNALSIKKKELITKMQSESYDDFYRWYSYRSATARPLYLNGLKSLPMAPTIMYFFDKSLHFCVSEIPEERTVKLNTDRFEEDMYIDFKYSGCDCFLYIWKRNFPLILDKIEYWYNIIVCSKNDKVMSVDRQSISSTCGQAWKFIPFMKYHITEDGIHHLSEINVNSQFAKITYEWDLFDIENTGEVAAFISDEEHMNEQFMQYGLPCYEIVISVINHATYCYENRGMLTRKNGVVSRKYNNNSVHITKPLESDVYVPLHVYAKEYEPSVRSEYKGGHHRSPIEHTRKEHYRKSRGRGNYDLVNNEYVYVGGMKGHYSLVPETKVNGTKNGFVRIYKTEEV